AARADALRLRQGRTGIACRGRAARSLRRPARGARTHWLNSVNAHDREPGLLPGSATGRITPEETPPMSHSPDDPPSDRVSPVSPPPPAASGESGPANTVPPQHADQEVKESTDPQPATPGGGDPPRRPRRRRGRRPPREAGAALPPGELSA